MKRIAITTGDIDGIGTEVTAKALLKLSDSERLNQFFIFSHTEAENSFFNQLNATKVKSFAAASELVTSGIFLILDQRNPTDWVNDCLQLSEDKKIDALVTGPLSKKTTMSSKFKVMGHTGLFRQRYKEHSLFMGFIGQEFNVILFTDHISLGEFQSTFSIQKLKSCIHESLQLRKILPRNQSLPLGLLAMNPHAGEGGLIGEEDLQIKQVVNDCGINVDGPLVPDAAFLKQNWGKYSFYIALYHDQGLIPFKLVHGQDSGFQVTLGLPFLRTSVDHGTANDIFKKNRANPNSMLDAIRFCL